jgi:hypothetical protein
MKLSATTKVDKGLMSALVDPETGLLRPGAMPAVQTANAGGCKTLLNTMGEVPRTKFIAHLLLNIPPKNHSLCWKLCGTPKAFSRPTNSFIGGIPTVPIYF